jgi:HSP20 family protein
MLYETALNTPALGLRRDVARLFDEMANRAWGTSNGWVPPVDVREDDKEIALMLELPGVKPENVEVTAENGMLRIQGEKRAERKEGDEERYHLVERTYGKFVRTFQLPKGVDESKIVADFEHGVLNVRVPKAALPQPRKITIGTGNANSVNSEDGER